VDRQGSTDRAGGPTDQRYYIFKLTQIDDSRDQSVFDGWQLTFTLVFSAMIPAQPENTTSFTR